MDRSFRNRAVALVVILTAALFSLLLRFCLTAVIKLLLNGSGAQYRNSLNISREQYETALAKWNSLHVTDYEATIKDSNLGKWRVVVHVDDAYGREYIPSLKASYSHKVVDFESLDGKEARYDPNLYQFATVGGLFDNVNDYLYCQEQSCKGREFFLPGRYIAEFDETMGYPRSVTSIDEYGTVETRIESLKIIR